MNQDKSNTGGELTLEPMEIDFRDHPIFGDFLSRDRGSPASINKKKLMAAGQLSDRPRPPVHHRQVKRKPAGKAVFMVDDRRTPDRRVAARRSAVRLTGDRRTGIDRRAVNNPANHGLMA
jgi:hypothetical protein